MKKHKISLGGIRGASGTFGPSLRKVQSWTRWRWRRQKFPQFLILQIFSSEDSDCTKTSAQRQHSHRRMPSYFEIDKDQLNAFFNKTGDLLPHS